jgi:hypothetical protein
VGCGNYDSRAKWSAFCIRESSPANSCWGERSTGCKSDDKKRPKRQRAALWRNVFAPLRRSLYPFFLPRVYREAISARASTIPELVITASGQHFSVAFLSNSKSSWVILNQNGDAITGTLVFTHPQGGRVQFPVTSVTSGVVSKDTVTFSGQNQFPMGSIEITFHGTVTGASLAGTADMTSPQRADRPAGEHCIG